MGICLLYDERFIKREARTVLQMDIRAQEGIFFILVSQMDHTPKGICMNTGIVFFRNSPHIPGLFQVMLCKLHTAVRRRGGRGIHGGDCPKGSNVSPGPVVVGMIQLRHNCLQAL